MLLKNKKCSKVAKTEDTKRYGNAMEKILENKKTRVGKNAEAQDMPYAASNTIRSILQKVITIGHCFFQRQKYKQNGGNVLLQDNFTRFF